MPSQLCTCGHPEARHDHYRPGTDCGTCGYQTCPYYATPTWWHRLRRRLTGE